MSFEMKFEALQPIGYGDYESGLAEGIKQGIEQGKFLGLQQGVSQTNAEVLVLTGTEKPTATQAIAEINITLATNLISKGVIALPDQTTETLAGKVADIRNPQDAYAEGVAKGVQTTNTDVLSVTGTAQHTAVEAVTEVNATLASILTDKGVEADASETTEALVGKATDIPSYDDGYNAGLAAGSTAADAFLDGTAFADGTYTNNTVKSLRADVLRNTGVTKVYFGSVETLQASAFDNYSPITYVHFPKLKRISMNAFRFASKITGDWSFLPRLEYIEGQCFRGCSLPESINFEELTELLTEGGSPFDEVTTIKHLQFPKVRSYPRSTLCNCNSTIQLETIVCGSVGYPVTSISASAFQNSKSGSLTSITIYCEDPNNPPTGSPWGAPNATVTFLKA